MGGFNFKMINKAFLFIVVFTLLLFSCVFSIKSWASGKKDGRDNDLSIKAETINPESILLHSFYLKTDMKVDNKPVPVVYFKSFDYLYFLSSKTLQKRWISREKYTEELGSLSTKIVQFNPFIMSVSLIRKVILFDKGFFAIATEVTYLWLLTVTLLLFYWGVYYTKKSIAMIKR